MAAPEEREVVVARSRDDAQAQIIARNLGQLLQKRLAASYRDTQQQVPPRLFSSSFLVNSVIEHLTKSKLVVDSVAFAEWRKAGASPQTGAVAQPSQPSASQPSASSQPSAASPKRLGDAAASPSPRKSPRPLGQTAAAAAEEAEDSNSGESSPPSSPRPARPAAHSVVELSESNDSDCSQ